VIAIIGVLVALLLPAIQAAREAARNAQCKNNLRQVGVGMLNYETTKGEFPAGGWGFRWMGDPDAGTGARQPGGWVFQMAPYLEQVNVTRLGGGTVGNARKVALAQQRGAVIATFYCPTRRQPLTLPARELCHNANSDQDVPGVVDAKSDYAANGGANRLAPGNGPAPNDDLTDCVAGFPNCAWDAPTDAAIINTPFNGIITGRTGAQMRQISDGTSNTIMAGEKYLPTEYYEQVTFENKTGHNAADDNPGDNSSLYQGYDQDTVRWPNGRIEDGQPQGNLPVRDSEPVGNFPTRVQFYKSTGAHRMGGPHASSLNLVYVDGSVHSIEFEVDAIVWNSLANREDGG
jgi:hypothetical protein